MAQSPCIGLFFRPVLTYLLNPTVIAMYNLTMLGCPPCLAQLLEVLLAVRWFFWKNGSAVQWKKWWHESLPEEKWWLIVYKYAIQCLQIPKKTSQVASLSSSGAALLGFLNEFKKLRSRISLSLTILWWKARWFQWYRAFRHEKNPGHHHILA